MSSSPTPNSVAELLEAVRSTPRLLAIGAGTKPRLSAVETAKLSTRTLRGILEYEPEEFTFTALAGTPLEEIEAAVGNRGQYLPFDPMCVQAGATLGGTVAAGLSGPGRFRFGGLRDFILGIRFVDGRGRLLRMGGKVVKNAAGFDLPKFFVGSLGRFGILAEITFKVFPRPASSLTLRLAADGPEATVDKLTRTANSRWQPDALDLLPDRKSLYLRLAGPAGALPQIAGEILERWNGEILSAEAADQLWTELREFGWAHPGGALIKIPLTPPTWPALESVLQPLEGARVHVSAGGNVAFVSLADPAQTAALATGLDKLGLRALTLRGEAPLLFGRKSQPAIAAAVKQALDPEQRFPPLED